LKRRYNRAARRTLALRAVLFQEQLDLFDRGALPIDEQTRALFDEDNEAAPGSAMPGAGAGGKAEADDAMDGDEDEEPKARPSERVLQIHALYRIWQENKLPKNDFNKFVRLQPPNLVCSRSPEYVCLLRCTPARNNADTFSFSKARYLADGTELC
jgi:hypothetical protein